MVGHTQGKAIIYTRAHIFSRKLVCLIYIFPLSVGSCQFQHLPTILTSISSLRSSAYRDGEQQQKDRSDLRHEGRSEQ